ncbi:DUF3300 domain-containing protein [bacterium]|nr:DUF3300 domain-containing protein [bacterium]
MMNRHIKINMGLIAIALMVFGTGAALTGDLAPTPTAQPPSVQPAQQPPASTSENVAPAMMSAGQIDELVAPIALYPDVLLANVLAASTYPLDVVEADRWVKANPNATQEQIDQQSWDASVKALAHFPQVLSMMSEKLSWTRELGQAFLNQEADVMASVQSDRQRAEQNGALQSNAQQKVEAEDNAIVIQPANPQVIYVPQYYPQYVYGSDFAYNQPYYPYYDTYPYYSGISYYPPVYCGPYFDYDCDWHHRCLYWGGWGWRHGFYDRDHFRHHFRDHRFDRDRHDQHDFDRFSSDHRWRRSDMKRQGGFAFDRSGMNRLGLTSDQFNRTINPARISQRLRSPSFSFGGDARGAQANRFSGIQINRYGAGGRIAPQTGIRGDSRVRTRDSFGQVRTGNSIRAGWMAQRWGRPQTTLGTQQGGTLGRSSNLGIRSGTTFRNYGTIAPRGYTLGRGGAIGSYTGNYGRNYRMGGLAGGSFNRGASMRSFGGFRGGGPMISDRGDSFRGGSFGGDHGGHFGGGIRGGIGRH